MSKKISFLIFFAVLLGLGSTVQAALLPVVNGSFEKDNDGNWITSQTNIWDVCEVGGWIVRDTTGWASGWNFADDAFSTIVEYEAADGNASYAAITWCDYNDPVQICEIYQALDANVDANVTIAANKRYTLTFNALNLHDTNNPVAYGEFCYSNGPNEVNDIKLASVSKVLTWPRWDKPDYAGWEEIEAEYIVLSGNPNIGKKLRIKISVPMPWFAGAYVAIDNVRAAWNWLSKAYSPIPADDADQVSRTTTLKWKPGLWAKTPAKKGGHEVYFGNTFADVDSATTATAGIFRGAVDANNYDPCAGDLVLGKTYYWRIDEVNAGYVPNPAPPYPPGGKWKGDIWSFTVEGRARNPSPADGAKDVPRNVILQWIAGTAAKYHDVYFGTSPSAVEAATTATSGIYKTRLNKGTGEYDTSGLNLKVGNRYFWRIDEVNTMTVKGYVWDFRVIDFMLIDDFEFYAGTTVLRVKWKDATTGLPGNANVWLNTDATFANGDGNSMQFEYYNNGSKNNSETKRTYSTNQDWSYAGNSVTRMELSYYGDLDNGPDPPMYVKLSDGTKTAQVNCPALGEVNTPWAEQWQHVWNIPLKDFKGVNLAKVSSIILGVGDLASEGGGKAEDGTIYFDDIRLWPPVCDSAMIGEANLHAVGDFTTAHQGGEDCITDYEDLQIMAERDWLMAGANVPPSAPPTSPIGWYKFDEGSGTTTKNDGSAGTTYNGTFVSAPVWSTDANRASSLDFVPTDDGILVNDSMNLTGYQNVTFTAWVRRDAAIAKYEGVIVICRDTTNNGTGLHTDSTATNALGYTWNNWAPSWQWTSGLVMPLNKWAFVALAVEPTVGKMYLAEPNSLSPNTYKLRSATNAWNHDGLSSTTPNTGGWDGTSRFYLGRDDPNKATVATFPGKIDDVRIYDYTLSTGNIMYLAGVSGTVYEPLEDFRADIDNDDKVDLTDYAILADHWLERLLWPMP